jgi:4-amino-4-deoxy-L-arabinose transferase-like glycosyltransferase
MCQGKNSWPVVITLAVAIGLAGLTKGPVGLVMQAATVLAYLVFGWVVRRRLRGAAAEAEPAAPSKQIDGRPRWSIGRVKGILFAAPSAVIRFAKWILTASIRAIMRLRKALVAVVVVAAVVMPWIILVDHRHPGFIRTALHHEVGDRATEALEGHKGPPGYYLALIWPIFLPWSLILPLAIVSAWQRLHVPHVRFALAAVVGPWLMLEIVQTKLPHYLLPCFPPLAFLAADALVQSFRGRDALAGRPFLAASGIWGGLIVLLGMTPWIAAKWFRPLPWAAMSIVTIAAAAYAILVITLLWRHRPERAMLVTGGGMIAVGAVLFGLFLPRLEFLRLSIRTADALKQNRVTAPGQAMMLEYKEPSLAFYQGGTIREDRATVITNKLLDSHPPWLVITQTMWDKADPSVRSRLTIVSRARGLNLADGVRVEEVLVVKQRSETAEASGQ